jgi:hypothetical protein
MNRVTLDNYAACAELLDNMWVDSNGPMSLRPGWGFQARLGVDKVRLHAFSRSITERFIICLSNNEMRIAAPETVNSFVSSDLIADIISRPAVVAPITNGDFTTLIGWTNASEPNATATIGSNRLLLNSDGFAIALVRQQVTTLNPGVLHAIEIDVRHGPVDFRCGSSSGNDDYWSLTGKKALRTGRYSLAITPSASTFWIQFESHVNRQVEVEGVAIAASGDMVIPTPWPTWSRADKFQHRGSRRPWRQ